MRRKGSNGKWLLRGMQYSYALHHPRTNPCLPSDNERIQNLAPQNLTEEEKLALTTTSPTEEPKQSTHTELPEELQRKIADILVSSDVSDEDKNLIFATFKKP